MNYAIILSGGVGSRLGIDMPKQYYKVDNKPIIQYVIEAIENCISIDGYVIVASKEWQEAILGCIKEMKSGNADKNTDRNTDRNIVGKTDEMCSKKFLGFALPGENRQLSIYHGLLALKEFAAEQDLILVQDAARPNTSLELLTKCLTIGDDKDGAMPVLPMKDTVYLSRTGKHVDALLNRAEIYAGQAPESFRFGKYLDANEQLLPNEIYKINGSTEPAIMAGMQIAMIDGEESNRKITTIEDLKWFEGRSI